jgi:hypothetical protein
LHFAADVFDVLLNLRRWNDEADDPAHAAIWRRRAVRYVVLDQVSGLGAPSKFAAYALLPRYEVEVTAPAGLDSRLTFERYMHLDDAEPLFDGHRAWTYLTRQLGFINLPYGQAPPEVATTFDTWYARREHLLHVDRQQLRLLVPPPSFQ